MLKRAVDADIVVASADHITPIVADAREADMEEFWTLSRKSVRTVLQDGLRESVACWTGRIDSRPVCMFGVAPSGTANIGHPWMVGTNLLEEYQFTFLRRCREQVATMLTLYPLLFNLVDKRNEQAVRWLRWLGFRFLDEKRCGEDGNLFYPFMMERSDV